MSYKFRELPSEHNMRLIRARTPGKFKPCQKPTSIFDPILEANMADKVLLKTTGASEGYNPLWSTEGHIKTKRRFAPTFKDMLK